MQPARWHEQNTVRVAVERQKLDVYELMGNHAAAAITRQTIERLDAQIAADLAREPEHRMNWNKGPATNKMDTQGM